MDEMQSPSDPADQGRIGIELQDDLEGDTLREECGVFGIYGHPEAAAITARPRLGRIGVSLVVFRLILLEFL